MAIYDNELDNEIELGKGVFDKDRFTNAVVKGLNKSRAANYRSAEKIASLLGVDNDIGSIANDILEQNKKLDSTGYDEVEFLSRYAPNVAVNKLLGYAFPVAVATSISSGYGDAKNEGRDYDVVDAAIDIVSLGMGSGLASKSKIGQKILEEFGRGNAGVPEPLTKAVMGLAGYHGAKEAGNTLLHTNTNYSYDKSFKQQAEDYYRNMIYNYLLENDEY